MVSYPIRVPRSSYRGSKPREVQKRDDYNRDASLLESLVNRLIEEQGPGVYHYYDIADRSGLSVERVGKILFAVDCGSNGFTVLRGAKGELLDAFKDRLE